MLGAGLAGPAWAGGLFLYEMATPDLGTASAGRAATADNAATAFGNPAGMTRLDQSQMLVGIQPAYGITHFDKDNETTVSGGNGGNALGFIPGLGGYYVYSATPDLKFGLSLGSDFGLSARYQSDWSGRFYALQEEIITLGAFPVAAYRINRWLSIGAGAQIIYGKLNSKTGINDVLDGGDASIDISSQDVGYGGIAGILVEPVEGTRFGVTYTSQVKLDFKEKPKTNNLGPLLKGALRRLRADRSQGRPGPDHSQPGDGQRLSRPDRQRGGHGQRRLAAVERVRQAEPGGGRRRPAARPPPISTTTTPGASRSAALQVSPDWSWSLGFAFDTSPISKSERTPALPLDQQIRVGTGLQYALNDRITIGTAYEYLNLGEADISRSRPFPGTIQGNYSTNEIDWFNATLSWKF